MSTTPYFRTLAGIGNLGVGTTSPTSNLQVVGNAYVSNALLTTNVIATTINAMTINVSSLSSPLPVSSGGTGTSIAVQNAVFAGPASGGSGAPAFRALASGDIPNPLSVTTIYGTIAGSNTGAFSNLSASNGTAIVTLSASNVNYGTLSTAVFPTSGVTAGIYGSGANVSQVTVDQYGRVTTASNVAITSSQWTTGTGNIYYLSNVGIGTSAVSSNLAVTGNAYVSNGILTTNLFANTLTLANATSTINVIGNVVATTFWGAHAGSNTGAFSNLSASNASGLSNLSASNVVLGTLSTSVFPTSGVTAGTYGSSANVARITVDTYGRVTSTSNVAVSGGGSQWTTGTGNVYYLSNVGIGTSSVTDPLTVNGDASFTRIKNFAFIFSPGLHNYLTMPAGTYKFIMKGAKGGAGFYSGTGYGGLGNSIEFIYTVSSLTTFYYQVGDTGADNPDAYLGGGGGGGTFFYDVTNSRYICIAGGGGGGGIGGSDGGDAGSLAAGPGSGYGGGGNIAAGGGGAFHAGGNGFNGSTGGGPGPYNSYGGASSYYGDTHGGFGGGGGGDGGGDGGESGGGGGGYTGGDGGNYGGGGGGTSYLISGATVVSEYLNDGVGYFACNNGNISYIGLLQTTNLNVGSSSIGGGAPAPYPLDVTGDMHCSGNVNCGGVFYCGNNNGSTAVGSIGGRMYFGGTYGDQNYSDGGQILSRLYATNESSELIIFKGNDTAGPSGPDRIRLRAAAVCFDTYPSTSSDPAAENIRMYINGSGNVGIGTTSPGYALDVTNDVNCSGSYRVGGILQPKIPSGLQGSWSAVSSVTINGFDLASAFYSAEIRLNWYKNGSAGNNGNVSFNFKDTGGNLLSVQEAYTVEFRPTGGVTNTGAVVYLASGAEPVAAEYGSVIRIWSVRPGGTGRRYHFTFESVGCYANIGATTNRGQGFVTVVTGTVSQIVVSCSSGTFGGVYSVVQYI